MQIGPESKENRLLELQLKELELRVNKLRDEENDRLLKRAYKEDKRIWDAGMDVFFRSMKKRASRDLPGAKAELARMRRRYPQTAKRCR